MTRQVYTIGYGNHSLEEIVDLVQRLDARLLDIRYMPMSRRPEFRSYHLKKVLGIHRYGHVQELGNVNYKNGGPIAIKDYAAGKGLIDIHDTPVILMCACGDPVGCHRTVVAQMLRADGYQVEELELGQKKEEIVQPKLF